MRWLVLTLVVLSFCACSKNTQMQTYPGPSGTPLLIIVQNSSTPYKQQLVKSLVEQMQVDVPINVMSYKDFTKNTDTFFAVLLLDDLWAGNKLNSTFNNLKELVDNQKLVVYLTNTRQDDLNKYNDIVAITGASELPKAKQKAQEIAKALYLKLSAYRQLGTKK